MCEGERLCGEGERVCVRGEDVYCGERYVCSKLQLLFY